MKGGKKMFEKINEFFSIENRDYKKMRKDQLHQNRKVEEYRSELM